MFFRRLVITLVAVVAVAALAPAQTTTTGATVTRTSSFPVVGLASSETAQVNVVNQATASSTGTAASCTGSIAFYNSSGTAIGTATSFTVTSGQVFSVNLAFAKLGATGIRATIRAVVTLTETTGSGVPCALASSMETYDTITGVTHVHLDQGGMEGPPAGGGGPGPGPGPGGH